MRNALALLALVMPVVISVSHGSETANDPAVLVQQAEQMVARNPTWRNRVGLAEMHRVASQRTASLEDLAAAAISVEGQPAAAEVLELLCWRMLPLMPADVEAFRGRVAQLRQRAPARGWLRVFEMLLALHDRDREALLTLAKAGPSPEWFPTHRAAQAHREILGKLGLSPNRAGLEVIASRTGEALHSLRDLDRGLTREAAFLRSIGRGEDARKLEQGRDGLRQSYFGASQHVVERLFALTLLGRGQERDALLERVKAHRYLTDRGALAELLERTDRGRAASQIIAPLLQSEVAFLESPPAPATLQPPARTEATIEAARKTEQDGSVTYEGKVQLLLGAVLVKCDRLVVVRPGEEGTTLTGTGSVVVNGLTGLQPIEADRFTLNPETGSFTFGGVVRLHNRDGTVKLRACTITRTGEVRDQRSLLDDFAGSIDVARKLELLPAITRVYTDDELPDDVRYLLALSLLRPHLSWHAPFLPAKPDPQIREQEEKAKHLREGNSSPWEEALGGEEWMLDDIPAKLRDELKQAVGGLNRDLDGKGERVKEPELTALPWRLKEPGHPDVTRALKLLDGVRTGDRQAYARRWAAEVRRNNTVLTFDVAGGYAAGKPAPVVMDVRNADRVAFRLYRVRKPATLLPVLNRIGVDFIYHDHGLQYGERLLRKLEDLAESKSKYGWREAELRDRMARALPALEPGDLVGRWEVDPRELKTVPASVLGERYNRDLRDRYREGDGEYFDDECLMHNDRLQRSYRAGRWDVSTWRCGTIVEVPGKAVAEAGAYVLTAEANGQTAYVPLVVDPLSMTLRRCRDGVLAMVSDADGKQPVAGAAVFSNQQQGEAITDAAGVAFARVFAAGDRAIVAHKDGRFAVGGFGRVFEGIYLGPWDRHHHDLAYRELEKLISRAREGDAKRYADRHVVAAYTDRPTYRPGQRVQFKLIVRRLAPEPNPGPAPQPKEFRAEDFDIASRLELLPDGTEVPYEVLDPRGRDLAAGRLRLNDHGTAAGQIDLPTETATGDYTLRLRIAGLDRLVPNVFAVQYYRRPNFELSASGVPPRMKKPESFKVQLSGQYYFGKPVAGGRIEVKLLQGDGGRPLAETDAKLDDNGKANVELVPPARLAGGKYAVVCSLTDDSDRTATTVLPLEVEGDGPRGGLAALPRFILADRPLSVPATADVIATAEDGGKLTFRPENGVAMVRLPSAGWYRLTAGKDAVTVFAYGGEAPRLAPPREWGEGPAWVDLSHYRSEVDGSPHRWMHRGPHVLALFDRQQAEVGGRVRLLIHVPFHRARLLFTLEGRTVLDYHVTEVADGPYHVLDLPIKRRHLPNFYLQGCLLSGDGAIDLPEKEQARDKERDARSSHDDSEDPRWCRIDVSDPNRPAGEERLTVQVETERKEYRPGEEVGVQLSVTDLQGRPRAAEVSLAAVDDSVFTFGEDNLASLANTFSDPHPPQRFLRKAWRSSRWRPRTEEHVRELMKKQDQAIQQLAEAKAASTTEKSLQDKDWLSKQIEPHVPLPLLRGEMPLESLPLGRLRTDFRETAVWLPQLRTDEGGTLKTSFKLPDSLTRYRLSAVALTRETEIGVGRAKVQASMPLSVQVFLPRFGVEKDRLLAVGLVHNNDSRDRSCAVAWEVRGAKVDGLADGFAARIDEWKAEDQAGRTVGRGKVTVPAGKSVRVGIWLALDRSGTAAVVFRCGDGKDSDAEERSLPVQPLGRPREVVFEGAFRGRTRVQLPDGFTAGDLRVVLARGDLARALDGLGGLVEYPYGCVEQTMSRFLPAVTVQAATRHAPVTLPPDVAQRLPDVLAKGRARLYHFQHDDGGWGWWERDATDDRMTAYVVYGLARCRLAGAPVNDRVLQCGRDYLQGRLRDAKVADHLVGPAWLSLALAGHAPPQELQKAAERARDTGSPEQRAQLALACQAAGLREMADRLWRRVCNWEPQTTEMLALNLNLKLAFGAPLEECMQPAARLMAARRGLQWENTQATSWAILALVQVLGYTTEKDAAKGIRVTVAGRDVLDVKNPAELRKLVHRVRVSGEQLPREDGVVVEMSAEWDDMVHYTVVTNGTQRQDKLEPSGRELRVRRGVETLDGKPFTGRLKVGDVVAVRLTVDLDARSEYVLLEDRRPAGCEFADQRLVTDPAWKPAHVEFRDDRVCAFFGALPAGRHEFVYYLRAETAGVSHVLPGCIYPMYADHLRGETGSLRLDIAPREKE